MRDEGKEETNKRGGGSKDRKTGQIHIQRYRKIHANKRNTHNAFPGPEDKF